MTGLPYLLVAAASLGSVWLIAHYETAIARNRADHERETPR